MWLQWTTVLFFIVYFYYVTRGSGERKTLSPPTTALVPHPSTFEQNLISHPPFLFYTVDEGAIAWQYRLPDEFTVHDQSIRVQDVCAGFSDGALVSATGKPLYDYIQRQDVTHVVPTFQSHTDFDRPEKRVFFFECRDARVRDLHMCPPGHVFVGQKCQALDRCTGQPDRMRLANVYDLTKYYECQSETSIPKQCSPDHLFVHSQCLNSLRTTYYCIFHAEPKVLDPHTVLKCLDGEPVYETCPPGHKYFDDRPVCESDACDGQPDGFRIPLPDEHRGPFRFSPGYRVCEHNTLGPVESCGEAWDAYQANDHLTHLPRVFDGQRCVQPTFCQNVFADDPDILVPAFEFSKHVSNWKHADAIDRLTGYQCHGKRKRVTLDPGQRIGKHFKRESACDTTTSHVPVAEQSEAYYDCQTGTVRTCPPNHYFDTTACVPRIKNSFRYRQYDFFVLDSLREDNWIAPWDYDKKPKVNPCGPESEYLESYNVCSHPECVPYPFLSMIGFELRLKDGSTCAFRESDRYIVKRDDDQKPYLFWSQRPGTGNDVCIPGKRIETGHFVWDSTIYMTCEEREPFVFCPSSDTTLVSRVADKKYACIPASTEIPAHTTMQMLTNEVDKLVSPEGALLYVDGTGDVIPPGGLDMGKRAFNVETLDAAIEVRYASRVTHPPDVVIAEGVPQVSKFGGAYLVKRSDFTQKPVGFPFYKIKEHANDFEW